MHAAGTGIDDFCPLSHCVPAGRDCREDMDETNDDRGAVPFAVRVPERTGGVSQTEDAPAQLTDWGETSARQAIELTEHFLDDFAVDAKRVYAAGYSAGGETMSRAVSMRPDLYAAYLHAASQWDGGLVSVTAHDVGVYIYIGSNDEYYGSQQAQDTYDALYAAYQADGRSDEQIASLLQIQMPDDAYFAQQGAGGYAHAAANVVFDDDEVLNWIIDHHK